MRYDREWNDFDEYLDSRWIEDEYSEISVEEASATGDPELPQDDEPHIDDCGVWAGEGCNCVTAARLRFDEED